MVGKEAMRKAMRKALGNPIYEGRSRATLGEVLAVDYLNDLSDGQVLYGYADLTTNKLYTEYEEVESFDGDYELYLHSYRLDSMIYTFVGREGVDTFDFYYIVGDESEDAAA